MKKQEVEQVIRELLKEGWLDRLKAKTSSVGSSDKNQAMANSRVKGLKKKASELLSYLLDTEQLFPDGSSTKEKLKSIEGTTHDLIANIDDFVSGREMGAPVAEPVRNEPETPAQRHPAPEPKRPERPRQLNLKRAPHPTQGYASPGQPEIGNIEPEVPSEPIPRSGNRVGKDRDAIRKAMGIGAKPRSGNRVKPQRRNYNSMDMPALGATQPSPAVKKAEPKKKDSTSKKSEPKKKAPAKKEPAKKAPAPKKSEPKKKAPEKKEPPKKTEPKKSEPKKSEPKKKTPAKKEPAKKSEPKKKVSEPKQSVQDLVKSRVKSKTSTGKDDTNTKGDDSFIKDAKSVLSKHKMLNSAAKEMRIDRSYLKQKFEDAGLNVKDFLKKGE